MPHVAPSRSRTAGARLRASASVAARGLVTASRDLPSSNAFAWAVYTTAPPRKYADAPGTASNAPAISPPADDSATATVSWRAISRSATGPAAAVRSSHPAIDVSPVLPEQLLHQDCGQWAAYQMAYRRWHLGGLGCALRKGFERQDEVAQLFCAVLVQQSNEAPKQLADRGASRIDDSRMMLIGVEPRVCQAQE